MSYRVETLTCSGRPKMPVDPLSRTAATCLPVPAGLRGGSTCAVVRDEETTPLCSSGDMQFCAFEELTDRGERSVFGLTREPEARCGCLWGLGAVGSRPRSAR